MNRGLEVHTHSYVTPRGAYEPKEVTHSHEVGDQPHQHEGMGPATYTIDKDEWFRATGMGGGGRKKFTTRPTGPQHPIVALADWQKSFEVVICNPTPPEWGTGPGVALPARMMQQFWMHVSRVRVERDDEKGAA